MPTFGEVGRSFAARLEQAVASDQRYVTKGLVKYASDLASSHLGSELIAIGRELDSLTYQDNTPLDEDAKEAIVEETAKAVGWNQPRTLRRLTKGGSVDALLTMAQQLEALFNAIRK